MIDTHCHINDEQYLNNPLEYINAAKEAGVDTLFVVGYDLKSSKFALEIASLDENVYALVGIHPSDVKKMNSGDLDEIESLISNKKVIGIGEIGLDYYWDKDEDVKKQQREYFIKQIELANKYNLPISIHCREAQEECLTILKEHKPLCGGIMHCYAGSKEMVKDYRKLGILIGVGGVVTFKNSVKLKEAVSDANFEDIVLETDAPYLAPVPYRGTPNHSKHIPIIASEVAKLKNTTVEHIEEVTNTNVKRVFKL
ncbi:MAG: TatD family hydrolase [Bacilli bacterium]|nr:TatD family hydrolase [Bacilli bacterium]